MHFSPPLTPVRTSVFVDARARGLHHPGDVPVRRIGVRQKHQRPETRIDVVRVHCRLYRAGGFNALVLATFLKLTFMDYPDSWPERIVLYALAASVVSALGCFVGIWLAVAFHGSIGPLSLLSGGGFVGGMLTGPILLYVLGAEAFTETTALAKRAKALLPFAYATALGSALGCVLGILTFALFPGRFGSLAHLCAGGFMGGSLAGVIVATFFAAWFSTLGEMPSQATPQQGAAQQELGLGF